MSSTDLVVEVDRVLQAGPRTVYRALTEAALYASWTGPAGADTLIEE